jgi:hypothetical protein
MGQGNELPHGAIQGCPLGGDLSLGFCLGVRHLTSGLRLYLDERGCQHLDSLVNVGTQAMHTGSCGSAKAQPGYALQPVKSSLV